MEKKYAFEHVGKYKGYQFIKIINGGIVWSYNECWMACVFDTVETAKYFIDSTKKFIDNFANVISDAQKVAIEKNKGYVSVDIVNQFIKKDTTMKKEIITDKVTILAVKVKGEVSSCHVRNPSARVPEMRLICHYSDLSGGSVKYDDIGLPEGRHWRIINALSAIKEEQADELVESVMGDQHYQNYNYIKITDRWVKTAKESFYSLMNKNGVYLENPYGGKDGPHIYDWFDGYDIGNATNEWKKAENNTGEWLILIEVK